MYTRRLRFVDTDFASALRPSTEPNPFADEEVPSDFKTIQELLAAEQNVSKVYKVVWSAAEKLYQEKKQTLPSDFFDPSIPEECYIAVIAYTMNTEVDVDGEIKQLYREFNSGFRNLTDQASWDEFGFKSFYYLLTMVVPGIKNVPEIDNYLYRGIKTYHFDPVPQVGDYFYFDYFASTTVDRAMAEEYLGPDGTLVELQDGATVAMGISKYSNAEEEQEVLVLPKNRFKVVGFEKAESKDRLILMKAGTVL